jgi:hypothetical protein
MPSYYYLEVSDAFGNKLAHLDSFIILTYARTVNTFGTLSFDLDPDFDRSIFTLDGRIKIMRQLDNDSLPVLEMDTIWLYRDYRIAMTETGLRHLRVVAVASQELLTRRIIPFYAGSSQASKSMEADDMMKEIVDENLGTAASASRTMSQFLDIERDFSFAPSVSKAFSRRQVYTVLQEIADLSKQKGTPLYFDIVANESSKLLFKTYIGQRGIDRTLSSLWPLVLSPEMGTISHGQYEEDYRDEVNYVYAAGEGEGITREVEEASDDARIGLSPLNRREALYDGRQGASAVRLQEEAETAVLEGRPKRIFTGRIAQTPQVKYGLHWNWGDRVTVQFEGQTFNCEISSVGVHIYEGEETITANLIAEEPL